MSTGFGSDFKFKKSGKLKKYSQFAIINVWEDITGNIHLKEIKNNNGVFYIDISLVLKWNCKEKSFNKIIPFGINEVIIAYKDKEETRMWICDNYKIINNIIRYPVQVIITKEPKDYISIEDIKFYFWGNDSGILGGTYYDD